MLIIKLADKYKTFKNLARLLVLLLFLSIYPSAASATDTELLTAPWTLSGNNGSAENYQTIDPNILAGKTMLSLTYNLHGFCLLSGDASAVIFDQPFGGDWHYVSLSGYGQNCLDGDQTVDIPLSDFYGLDLTKPVGNFHARIWDSGIFTVDVKSAKVSGSLPTPTPTATPSASPTPIPSDSFTGQYWNLGGAAFPPDIPTTAPDLERGDPVINFVWNDKSPDPKITTDHFAARWTKTQTFASGIYEFTVTADDGVRLYVDGEKILDKWIDQGSTTYKVSKTLTEGSHAIVLEYYENNGGAVAILNYQMTAIVISPPPGQVIQMTPFFANYWGNLLIDGVQAPLGTQVKAYSPRGNLVGEFSVTYTGMYGYMRVYGEDNMFGASIPGMRAGEQVTFKVNGIPAVSSPSAVLWQNDPSTHEVGLSVATTELLTSAWNLAGESGSIERYQYIDPTALQNKSTLKLTYDLHGLCILPGDASAVIINQPEGAWHYVSLSDYGKNCYNGVQSADIPLAAFPGLDLSQPVGVFHIRIWYPQPLTIDITSVKVF